MDSPLVSIVILNWNGFSDTAMCLESLKSLSYKNTELILVDNGSIDESKAKLPNLLEELSFPCTYIDLPKNTGFTGGHITGYKKARGELIWLLNNDCVVDPHIIDKAISRFNSDETIGVVGGRSFFWNNNNPPFNKKNGYYSYQSINPITAEVTTHEEGDEVQAANNVSGSSVFIKRSLIDGVGYLDARFFAYYEETDLFARVKKAGYKVVYDPALEIWHKVGASTKDKQSFYYFLTFKNQFVFAVKNFDSWYIRKFLIYYLYTFFFKALFFVLIGRDRLVNIARLKSFFWNLVHLPMTIKSRYEIQHKYGAGYSETILKETPQGISVLLDASMASKSQADRAVAALSTQTVRPKEIVIVTNRSSQPLYSRHEGIRVTTVHNKGLFGVHAFNLAFICSNQNRLLLLNHTSNLDQDFIEKLLKTALATNSGIVCPVSHRQKKFTLRNFRQDKSSCREVLISRNIMNSGEGLDDSIGNKDVALWDLLARAVLNSHAKVSYLLTAQESGNLKHEMLKESPNYMRLQDANLLALWAMSTFYPVGRFLKKFLLVIGNNKIFVLVRVLKGNVGVMQSKDPEAVPLKFMFSAFINFKLGDFKKALVTNYDLSKADQMSESAEKAEKHNFKTEDLPVFINCRDRVTDLKRLVAWLNSVGIKKIVLIDNGSTYSPLLAFFNNTSCQVLPLGSNRGHKAPWESLSVGMLAKDSYYVVSDPDVVPIDKCPPDALTYFYNLLRKYKKYHKVGFGLRIDNLPDHYKLKATVIDWERQFWQNEVEPNVYVADIDTTFALYRPNTWYFLEHSLRTGYPYIAEHTAWYQNSDKPTKEDIYYRERASSSVNTWNKDDIPEHFKKAIESLT